MRVVAAGLVLAFVAACAPVYSDHGYVPAPSELARVQIGEGQDQVRQTLGAPSIESMTKPRAWYYVQSRWRRSGPFAPREIKREVVAISFTDAGKARNIERFGLDHGRIVRLSRRVTGSTLRGVGLLQQLFGNLGRFNPGTFFRNNGAP